MARRSNTIRMSFSVSGAELKRQLEHDKACKRYRVESFLNYVERKSNGPFEIENAPNGYEFQRHFRDTLRALADVLTEDEITALIIELRFCRFGLPAAFQPATIRERLS